MAGSTTNATLNNLCIAGKLGNLMNSTQGIQGRLGGTNERINEHTHQTHSDSNTTRRTTGQTHRTNGGNPTLGFHHLLAHSTFDASNESGGRKIGRNIYG